MPLGREASKRTSIVKKRFIASSSSRSKEIPKKELSNESKEIKEISDKQESITKKEPKEIKKKNTRKGGSVDNLETISNRYNKKFSSRLTTEFMDTGSIGCNKCLGGGLAKGKISEWSSPAGIGKSTIACHFSKVICDRGGIVVYVDSEFAVNQSLLEGIGLLPYKGNLFLFYQLSGFTEVEELLDDFLKCSQPPALIIIDSITTLVPSKVLEGRMKIEDVEPGLQSRLMSMFFLKYKGKLAKTGTHMMLINQQRYKINFHGPTVLDSAGGNAMKFGPDIKIKITKKHDIKDNDIKIGVDANIEATKNKFTSPFISYLISVLFGKGISNVRACTFLLEGEGKVIQKGPFFTIDIGEGEMTFKGRMRLEEYLKGKEKEVVKFLTEKGYV